MSATRIHIAITIAAAVWAVLLVLQGVKLGESYLRPYEIAAGVAVLALSAYDLLLWRFRPFVWFAAKPVLRGTWKGMLKTTWVDPTTGTTPGPIEVYLAIHQTYSTVSVALLAAESQSGSMAAEVSQEWPDRYKLVASYMNVPRQLVRVGSPIHHGTMLLGIAGKRPARLEGSYWTDRGTQGEVTFEQSLSKIHGDFPMAQRAFTG